MYLLREFDLRAEYSPRNTGSITQWGVGVVIHRLLSDACEAHRPCRCQSSCSKSMANHRNAFDECFFILLCASGSSDYRACRTTKALNMRLKRCHRRHRKVAHNPGSEVVSTTFTLSKLFQSMWILFLVQPTEIRGCQTNECSIN